MLADSIDGGIFTLLVILGEMVTIFLALFALIPAAYGNRPLVVVLIAPTILMAIFTTCWLAQGYFLSDPQERQKMGSTPVQMWFLFAFPPLLTSLTSFSIACYKRKHRQPAGPEADPA
jgi:hypothetical protein